MAGSGIDAVVVNYNAASDLQACLESLVAESVSRIVVVDNDSHDSSAQIVAELALRYPNIEWLPTGANLGFGRAANRGFAATTSPHVFLLNPDAVVVPGALARMQRVLDASPQTGVIGPRVSNFDGTHYPSARAFPNMIDAMGHGALGLVAPRNRWSTRYRNPDHIDWVSGTAMLLRRSAFEAIGGFDESYFMYVEDVDLCWRLHAAGWGVSFVPDALVRHRIGGSSEQRPYRMIVAHHRSLLRFALKTTRGPARVALPIVVAGLGARIVAASVSRFLRKSPPASH